MDLKTIGIRLISLRKSKGISQIDLANKIGLDRTYLSRVETGKQNLTMDNFIKICDGLNVSLKEFFDF